MSFVFNFAARSDIGLGRYKNNQDSGFAGSRLIGVCDGMGGHAGGDVASSIAVAHLAALNEEGVSSEPAEELSAVIRESHSEMLQHVTDNPEVTGMGTTVTAILRHGKTLALAHIGDSRAYRLRDNQLTQITKDHTFVQWLIDEGRITHAEAEVHPQRSVIMRVLGDVDARDELDISLQEGQIGDRWLLCSDGLSGAVSFDTLHDTLINIENPGECADALVDLALKAGGQDNITCIVADLVPPEVQPDNSPQVVGAAALRQPAGSVSGDSPAAKAAALTATAAPRDDIDDGAMDAIANEERHSPVGIIITAVVVLAILAGGLFAAYRWTKTQYFVGTHESSVAIYQGLPQDLGPVSLSWLQSVETLPLDALSVADQRDLKSGITANDLPDARRIAKRLLSTSELCQPAPTTPETPADSETPSAPAEPGAPTPDPGVPASEPPTQPEPQQPPTPEPTATTTLNVRGEPMPDGCES